MCRNCFNHFIIGEIKFFLHCINDSNIFPMWDWVGGRFSLWGSVGLAINLFIGSKNFNDLLIGANEMDNHFKSGPISKNIPLLAACISIWYNNFFDLKLML